MKRVVVTGMGAVTPVGNHVPAFWNSISNGISGIDEITRFDCSQWKYRLAAEVKNFDPAPIIEKGAVRKLDLFSQYAIVAAMEAASDSGIADAVDSERLGVYFGSGVGGFTTMCQEHENLLNHGPRKVSPHFIPKMIFNMAAGHISMRLKATGPSMALSTACATGTTAIGEAYRAIAGGFADAILCGGSEAAIIPLTVAGFGSCMALTTSVDKNAASLPFDKRRGGFVLGEGAAALMLEEYNHATARGAHIYAEVCGYGATCDAHHVTAPDPEATAAARAITLAMAGNMDVDAARIYCNAHGTGTPLNDKTETLAIKKALGAAAQDLHISSTKSMTGHMLGAAGAAEAIASILALQENTVPPTIHLQEPDPECDLHYTPNQAVHTPLDIAFSTSLGFGGHNACIAFRKV